MRKKGIMLLVLSLFIMTCLTGCLKVQMDFIPLRAAMSASRIHTTLGTITDQQKEIIFNLTGSPVEIRYSDNNEITAEYDNDVFAVDLEKQEHSIDIIVTASKRPVPPNNRIRLTIPRCEYNKMNFHLSDSVLYDLDLSGDLQIDLDESSLDAKLPSGFSGNITGRVLNSSVLNLAAKDERLYDNYNIEISGDKDSMLDMRDGLTEVYNNDFIYRNGLQDADAIIRLEMENDSITVLE